jgi:tRNA uridine 5-carbamoylmethylation protein Kti12
MMANNRGRPPNKRAIGAWLCATIANKLTQENNLISVTDAARAALDATYSLVGAKAEWKESTDAMAVEQVRKKVYLIQKNPNLAVQHSPLLTLKAKDALKNRIKELNQEKSVAEKADQTPKAKYIKRQINGLEKTTKQSDAFINEQARERASLVKLAKERGIKLSEDDLKKIKAQQLEDFKLSVSRNNKNPKPFSKK